MSDYGRSADNPVRVSGFYEEQRYLACLRKSGSAAPLRYERLGSRCAGATERFAGQAQKQQMGAYLLKSTLWGEDSRDACELSEQDLNWVAAAGENNRTPLIKYYVYQYAAISASCDIARRIAGGEEGAVESCFNYISSGDPASTADTLLIAGVDVSSGDFVDGLLTRFSTLMDEYEAIRTR